MLLAGLLFRTQDAIVKFLSAEYPTIQILWARFFVPVVLVASIFHSRLGRLLTTQRLGLQLVRFALIIVMLGLLFTSYRLMPLADANAIMFFGPILVTALSVPVLGERVAPRRMPPWQQQRVPIRTRTA